jgi:AcrR family transcriptional regulator
MTTTDSSKPRGKQGYHHGNLREDLMRAALEIIHESGAAALSLRDAARRAGVSHAAPYRHFKGKGVLLAALAVESFHGLVDALERAKAACGDDVVARLRAGGLAYVRYAVRHPSRFRLMFGPDRELIDDKAAAAEVAAAGQAAYRQLYDSIADCQRAGVIRPDPTDSIAQPAWALMHGLAALLVDRRIEAADDAALEALVGHSQRILYEGMRSG